VPGRSTRSLEGIVRRDTLGGVAAVVLGVAYAFALDSDIWGHESPLPLPAVVAMFASGAFLSLVALSAWAKPDRPWLFPGLFSVPLLFLATPYLHPWDWVGVGIFLSIAGATFLVGFAACVVVRAIVAVRRKVP